MPSYQSKSFTFFRQQFLRVRDTAARSARQGMLFAAWTLQIGLYPIYLVFQSSRVLGRQLQFSVRRTLPRLRAAGEAIDRVIHPDKPPKLPLSSDTPLNNLLRSLPAQIPHLIQSDLEGTYLALPADQELLLLHDPESASVGASLPDSLLVVGDIKGAIAPSTPTAQSLSTTTSNVNTADFAERILIQGMASLLGDRHLVLVGENNHVLDVLSLAQQQWLQERIVLELSTYRQQQRQRSLPIAPSLRRLPLPQINDRQWLPVQWFRRAMAWMQTSDVAIATNLFQESLALPKTHLTPYPTYPHSQQSRPWNWPRLPSAQALMLKTNPDIQPLQPTLSESTSHAHTQLHDAQPNISTLLGLWSRFRSWLTSVSVQEGIATDEPSLFDTSESGAIAQSSSTSLAQPEQKGRDLVTSKGDRPSLQIQPVTTETTVSSEAATVESSNLQPLSAPQTSVESQPVWVETSAIDVGYAKHPLVLILEWLDSGVAWIEQHVMRIWQWATGKAPTPPDD